MDGLAQNCGNCMQCVGSTVMIVLPQAVDKWIPKLKQCKEQASNQSDPALNWLLSHFSYRSILHKMHEWSNSTNVIVMSVM